MKASNDESFQDAKMAPWYKIAMREGMSLWKFLPVAAKR